MLISPRLSLGALFALPLSALVLFAGTWWWRSMVVRHKPSESFQESWEHVKTTYPLLEPVSESPIVAAHVSEMIIEANPFSATRQVASGSGATGVAGKNGEAPGPTTPKFVYKGRIQVSNRIRAIIEDTTAKKTHFLEVGQEVARFKVLDIAENQVVLSDPQTHEDVVVSLAVTQHP